tara:strand:- start:944 stop:1801 length:858 start_codon:yes stop_codon:yes gene_type:complete
MKPRFRQIIKELFPDMQNEMINFHLSKSICDTKFSPTINFNSLFEDSKDNFEKIKVIQERLEAMMKSILAEAKSNGLEDSFFLHISPNLGTKDGMEIIKRAKPDDIGSTDIQLLLKGAVKDSGVLFLLNKYIGEKKNKYPFGKNFNFRDAPKSIKEKIELCKKYISPKDMPLIIGVGDTITSQKNSKNGLFSRGGSDRSFLELIQTIGYEYETRNTIIFVDSSQGEVFRPSTRLTGLRGITDEEDFLKFDLIFQNGHKEYINWFKNIANKRYKSRNKKFDDYILN